MGLRITWQLLTRYFKQIDLIWWVLFLFLLAIATVVFIVYRKRGGTHKAVYCCFIIAYGFFIFAATVFSRDTLGEHYWDSLINFDVTTTWSIPQWKYGLIDTAIGVGLNILMFFPFGYLLGRLFKKPAIALGISFLITLSIETMQLVTKRGFFELPDILLNMTGAVIGYYIAAIVNKRESNGEAGKKTNDN